MKTLLIDNYDSFTYNLFQLIAEANGDEPLVVRHDEASWDELARLDVDNVVISPGPGRPERAADFGVCAAAIERATVPVLGVCLGHQGLVHVSGGRVVHAPEVMHGRLSPVFHDGSPLFAGIPQGFDAVRYHSLCVAEPLPPSLERIAWTAAGVVMGVADRQRPRWGVQFHPESICTAHGRRLLENFRDLTLSARDGGGRPRAAGRAADARAHRDASAVRPAAAAARGAGPRLCVRRVDRLADAEQAFVTLFGAAEHAFWLDSSKVDERSRFSFMGAVGGPHSAVVTYDVGARTVEVRGPDGTVETDARSIFDWLDDRLRALRQPAGELPFDFDCGFVGWFGYELKADCGGDPAHASTLPDAAFLLADRLLAFDHVEGCVYLLALADEATGADAEAWLAVTEAALGALGPRAGDAEVLAAGGHPEATFALSRAPEQYLDDIARCQRELADGESYEICLTNKLHADVVPDPLPLYRRLRRVNPAPFSAYLRFGDAAVLSSSPERFLRVGRDRWAEAKPIKGTAPRGGTPEEDAAIAEALRADEKSRAENLMICDLLRNDLGIVCDVGTVHVPHLIAIESYETVHQLVSTVRGRLRDDRGVAACVRACFPGGSMTGAPKKRTMEIIDELEGEPRGVYSGAIGYLGLGGACDLNIVIRTIVCDGASTTIGVGGAIVMQSDPQAEYEEIMLKGRALMEAIAPGWDPAEALRERDAVS